MRLCHSMIIGLLIVMAFAVHAQADEKPPKERAFDLGDGVTMEFLLIPAGKFLMGDDNGNDNEKPVHQVTITKPFYLGKHEVTQRQWETVMGRNPSTFKGPEHPVENVGWKDARAFVAKLNRKFAGIGATFSLPTEAQWEYACRAGGTGAFCFGDEEKELGTYAWYNDNADCRTHPVGQKKPNAWGLFDMHGNVLEWCADWHGACYYGQSPACDPKGPRRGVGRVLRGGGWGGLASTCRAAYRPVVTAPTFRNSLFGLRMSCAAGSTSNPTSKIDGSRR